MTLRDLIGAVDRARGLLPAYDRCEIESGSILLWTGGTLRVRVSFDMWAEGTEPHQVEMMIGDFLDLFIAREKLRLMEPPEDVIREALNEAFTNGWNAHFEMVDPEDDPPYETDVELRRDEDVAELLEAEGK